MHLRNELDFLLGILIGGDCEGGRTGRSGIARNRQEVDIRSGIVILPAGPTYTALPIIGDWGFPVCVSCPVLYCS